MVNIILCLTLFSLSLINASLATNPENSHNSNNQNQKNNPKRKTEIGVYELKKGNITIKVTNYGATVISVLLPDKNGKFPIYFSFYFNWY